MSNGGGTIPRSRNSIHMKVMLVVGSLPPAVCGVGAYVRRLALALADRRGCEIVLAAARNGKDSENAAWRELSVDSWSLRGLSQLASSIQRERPSIVHIHYPAAGYGSSWAPYWLPLRASHTSSFVQTWHEPIWRSRSLVRYSPAAITSDALVVTEPSWDHRMPRWYRALMSRKRLTRFIPVGSSIPLVPYSEVASALVRGTYNAIGKRLLMHFGIRNEAKGTAEIFGIANPDTDRILLIGELQPGVAFHDVVRQLIESEPWRGKAFVTGYVSDRRAAELLTCADAAIYPFADGAGRRNTSLLAAQQQGVFVATTSTVPSYYDNETNTFYSDIRRPDWRTDLSAAIGRYSGRRREVPLTQEWDAIADAHLALYKEVRP